MSADLLAYDYHAGALVAAIAAAGAEAWLAIDPNSEQSPATLTAELKRQGVTEAALDRTQSIRLAHGNIWMRDYGPLAVGDSSHLQWIDFVYADPSGKDNDAFPKAAGVALGIPVEAAGLELDGGNFLTNGDFCFTTTTDLPKPNEHLPEASQSVLGRMGCRQVVVIKDPPHAHLDMWAKIVSDRDILVNEIDQHTLAVAKRLYGHVPAELKELRDSLNGKAKELSKYMRVHRLPMPLPYRGAFRTYANSVLVNGRAIVPSYERFGWGYDDYPDAKLKNYYERKVQRTYRSLGFDVVMINADGLIYNGGAFHCVTSPISQVKESIRQDSLQVLKGH